MCQEDVGGEFFIKHTKMKTLYIFIDNMYIQDYN